MKQVKEGLTFFQKPILLKRNLLCANHNPTWPWLPEHNYRIGIITYLLYNHEQVTFVAANSSAPFLLTSKKLVANSKKEEPRADK